MSRKPLAIALAVGVLGFGVGVGSLATALSGGGRGFNIEVPPVVGTDVASTAKTSTRFPKAGVDAFESIAEVGIIQGNDCATNPALQPMTVRAAGPTIVQRGNPTGKLVDQIQTEIVGMELVGYHPQLGKVVVTESQSQASTGVVQQIGKDPKSTKKKKVPDPGDLPATSFFDVFVEIQLPETAPGQTLVNQQAVRMENQAIRSIPPIGSEYRSAPVRVPLFFQNGTPAPFCIVHAVHVPEDPSHVLIFLETQRLLFAVCRALQATNCPLAVP